jgi:hypothetical protein
MHLCLSDIIWIEMAMDAKYILPRDAAAFGEMPRRKRG